MASPMLVGFGGLVDLVIAGYPAGKPAIPSAPKAIWDGFARHGFVTGETIESHSNYIYDLFEAGGLVDHGAVTSGTWYADAAALLRKELVAAAGRKQQAISFFLAGDTLLKVGNSLHSADSYFTSKGVGKKWLEGRTRTSTDVDDLVVEIAYPSPTSPTHVYNYGLTKTVLWLHSYNLANHLTPDSGQVRHLVEDYTGIPPPEVGGDSPAIYWADYFNYYIKPLKKLAGELAVALKKPVSVRGAQLAGWVLYSVRTLLKLYPPKVKRKLSADAFCRYLGAGSVHLSSVMDQIGDINLVDGLASSVYSYLSGLP